MSQEQISAFQNLIPQNFSLIIIEFANFISERQDNSKPLLLNCINGQFVGSINANATTVLIEGDITASKNFSHQFQKLLRSLPNVKNIILGNRSDSPQKVETFQEFLKANDISTEFIGSFVNDNDQIEALVLISNSNYHFPLDVPDDFRVIALISAYNEDDVIISVIHDFYKQGVGVYLIDNWSTDDTYQKALTCEGKGLIGIEKFPKDKPSQTYDWENLLNRKAELAEELNANWFIHSDADEIRESPWAGITLREALYRVDCEGFNAVDYTVINFPPVDNEYLENSPLIDHFKYFEFGNRPGHFLQIKSWKHLPVKVDLSSSGGHEVKFENRRIYPLKFLLRHYPFRSQLQGEKKVFQERKPRWNPEGRKKGWHIQYDDFYPGHNFLKTPEQLLLFDNNFYSNFITERLTGVGIKKLINSKENNSKADAKTGNFLEPNKYARPFSIEENHDEITFHGYQEFTLAHDYLKILDVDQNLIKKSTLLQSTITPQLVNDRSFLDLGANSGYFCFQALQNGAKNAVAVEMDPEYVAGLNAAKQKFSFENFEIIEDNFEEIQSKADIVVALAFIHWAFSCTAKFGSLDSVIKKLAEMTNYALIVEWIDPEDPAIKFFDHIHWNSDYISETYSFSTFEAALKKYLPRMRLIGDVTSTRQVFIANKTTHDIFADSPLPILDTGKLISARHLATYNGTDYWSQVYDDGQFIYKQATLDLASREYDLLQKIDSSYFPKILGAKKSDQYSLIKMEKIQGQSLVDCAGEIKADRNTFYTFIRGLLDILEILSKNSITHRDIRPENIMVKDNLPILIDFGWAVSPDHPYFTPPGLGAEYAPKDHQLSDVYSMGMVINYVNQDQYPEVTAWLKLLTGEDPQNRIDFIPALKRLFYLTVEGVKDKEDTGADLATYFFIKQYNQLIKLSVSTEQYEMEYQRLISKEKEYKKQIHLLETQLLALEQKTQSQDIQAKSLEQKNQELDRQLSDSKNNLQQARDELLVYALSTSWQVTRPFRRLMQIIRGQK